MKPKSSKGSHELTLVDGDSYLIGKENKHVLITRYSLSSAKNDAHNRKPGIHQGKAAVCVF